MKKLIVSLAFLVVLTSSSKAFLISDFGSASFSIDTGTTSFTTNQTAVDTSVIGLDNNIFAGTFTTPFDATGYTVFTLNGNVSGTNPGTTFNVDFYNSTFDQTRTYTAYLSDFGSVTTPVLLTFVSQTAVFNDFAGFQFSGGGTGSALNMTFTSVSAAAVPEPATWALLAGSLTTVMVFRRRVKA